MKTIKTINISILITLFFLISTLGVKSDFPITSLGVIDLNLILAESKAAKKASEEIEKVALKIEEDIKKSEENLIAEQNELVESQAVMSPESFESKMNDFQKKVENFNISRQEKLSSLDKMIADARLKVLDALEPILEEITEEEGVTIVLDKSIILLNNEKMDLTKKVLKKLNKELPSINILTE